MDHSSFLGNTDISTIEKIYSQYLENPNQVDPSWHNFFKGFEFAQKFYPDISQDSKLLDKEFKVINLIDAYRKRGHLFTKTNPVRTRRSYTPTLDPENFDLSEKDLDTVFQAGFQIGIGPAKLKDIIAHLQETYCSSLGVEYMYIRNPDITSWLQEKMEYTKNQPDFGVDEKKQIYDHLKHAVGFERFIHKKFIGQKRFSLEGAESLIPSLASVIDKGADLGIEEFVLGISHRGRLNVLTNILKKPVKDVFDEFVGEEFDESKLLGDVKYHLGYSNLITAHNGKKIWLNMAPNSSHLEAVDPIVEGISKARIIHKYKNNFNKLAPILIHGDAAIAAQGVVYETLQMSQLPAYETGGTIHLVINNQVGFTTNYLEGRSSTYCTDIGKVTKAPIFHVNGDDVEEVVYTIQLAMEYRQKFHTDVFVDLLCYRRHGHNEGDEPRYTQPLLYKAITKHPNPRDIYSQYLVEKGIYTKQEVRKWEKDYDQWLDARLEEAKQSVKVHIKQFMENDWEDYIHPEYKDFDQSPDSNVPLEKLYKVADKINHLPADLKFFKKLHKLVEQRKTMVKENKLDWGMAELLAYGTLADEGYPVRLTGQDTERGTFSHRHSSFTVENTDKKYFPLNHISKNQAICHIFNSPLSEFGIMGFEYGYALAAPDGLTIWEAQYGDFSNMAQVIIDQYISSAEEKWGVMNGITIFLPHGYEGQGPEHSSARMERFLNLCVNNNMQIVNCTTPANFYHVLRRQVYRNFRVPLILFTPKSLLRHHRATSTMKELAEDKFAKVIDDKEVRADKVNRMVFCSGKIYYDLLERREHFEALDVALIRIEQLYPFPEKEIEQILKKYNNAIRWLWVQEEPENMGAWNYIREQLRNVEIQGVTRLPSASPAVGLFKLHEIEQNEILGKVFRKCTCELNYKYCNLDCEVGSYRKPIKQKNYIKS